MVSVGQQLSLMCIGQDVRGNIKLSLKATLWRKGSKADNVVRGSEAPLKQEADNCAKSVEEERIEQEKRDSSEEDEQLENQIDTAIFSSASPAVHIRSAAECDQGEEKPMESLRSSSPASRNSKKLKKERSNAKVVSDNESGDDSYSTRSQENENDVGAKIEAPMSARKLKIGMEVTAKVLQIRARGLVLDLGGGVRGMYRFEVRLTLFCCLSCTCRNAHMHCPIKPSINISPPTAASISKISISFWTKSDMYLLICIFC